MASILDVEGLEPYPELCDIDVDDKGNITEPCGGRLWVRGGTGYYNGQYDCYTLYLFCEFCADYEWECV